MTTSNAAPPPLVDSEPLCEGCTALYREPVTLERCRRGLRRVQGEDAPEPMDRAAECAAMLLPLRENWIPRLPHDAALRGIATGDDLYVLLSGVRMRRVTEPDESGRSQAWWELTENGRGRTVVPAAPELAKLREWGLAR